MIKIEFDKWLRIFRKFGKEKVNKRGKSFEEYLTYEENYFKIIEMWFAGLFHLKKQNITGKIKEKSIYLYRKLKSSQRKKEIQENEKPGGIVFFPIGESHITLFKPIIDKLNKEAYVLRCDYALNGLKRELVAKKIPYINIEKYTNKDVAKKALFIKKRYKNALKIAKRIIKKKKEYKKLLPVFNYYFGARKRFYEIIDFVEGFKNFLKINKPGIVILPDETIDIARAVSYLCKKNKTPCIVMQHGSINKMTSEPGETYADKKIVFGESGKKFLLSKGMNKDKIEVTGSPVYDKIINNKIFEKEQNKIKKNLGIKNEKIILFASTWSIERAEPRLRVLFKTAKKNPNLRVIIKEHPSEYHQKKFDEFYKKLAKQYGVEIIINKDDMRKMLSISDYFTTDFSTTISEAIILKKPIILTGFEGGFKDYYIDFPEVKGVIWHALNPKQFEKALERAIKKNKYKYSKKGREKLIKRNFYKDDGRACKRIIKLINKLKK
jgi:D-Tyr-tRNAtyr deacylase